MVFGCFLYPQNGLLLDSKAFIRCVYPFHPIQQHPLIKQHCQDIGNKYLANKEEKEKAAPRNTIFDGLLDTVSGNKLSTNDAAALFQQAAVLMIAGTGSPAITLTAAIFYTLKSKDIQTNLRSELDDFERRTRGINAPGFDWRVLNQLPYLVCYTSKTNKKEQIRKRE